MSENLNIDEWDHIITPDSANYPLSVHDLWRYRDLIVLFVKRDFHVFYKQTILGPIWYLIQPIITTLVFTLVFNRVAQVSTDGTMPFLFYLSGVVCWTYFSNCLIHTSDTFIKNAGIFGFAFFPRLTVPVSMVIFNLVQLGLQFSVFLIFYFFYKSIGVFIEPTWVMVLVPFCIIQIGLLGLGCGLIVSAITAKYRDFAFLLHFFVQVWMFLTPVVYPAALVPVGYKWIYFLNPMVSVIETFRMAFLGQGTINIFSFLVSWMITIGVIYLGIRMFNQVSKKFIDTI